MCSARAFADIYDMPNLGFKTLNRENWLEADPAIELFATFGADGERRPISSEDMLVHIFQPHLSEKVPDEIRAPYEVARGTMCHGYFFYPLYTLATQQLFRVAEAAVYTKCNQLGATRRIGTFQQRIEHLRKTGVISDSDRERWHAIRSLRNLASHPDGQEIFPPGMAIDALEMIARATNTLFGAA